MAYSHVAGQQNREIRLVKVRFAQDLDSAVLPLAKQLSSGNNALHAVCGMGTIKDAAIAASTNRVFLHPRSVPFRHFSSERNISAEILYQNRVA